MANRQNKQADGLVYGVDAGGNTSWSAGPAVYAQSRRIVRLLKHLFSTDTKPPTELILILLDGVRPSSLNDIAAESSAIYQLSEVHYLQWTCSKTGVLQRREVSSMTVKHWPRLQADTPGPCMSPFIPLADGHKERLESFLRACPPYAGLMNAVFKLEEDVIGWWSINLHPVMFAHLADLQTLNPVERTTLARRAFQRPPKESSVATDHAEDLGASGDFIDAAMSSESLDVHSGVIELAWDVFGHISSPIDGMAKRSWLSALRALLNQSMHAGPWACLVIGWGCYMTESGTLTESNPAVSTLQSYFRKAARPLHNSLTNMPLDFEDMLWSSDALSDMFQAVIDQQSVGNQAVMRAALLSFHAFMAEHFDIAPLQRLLNVEQSLRPTPNLVWEHEIALACRWARNHPDLYIGAPAQLVISIAAEAACRAGELTRLRLCNICFIDDAKLRLVEIEIVRDASAGRLKTHASQRRVFVKSGVTLRLLRAWIRLRVRQGAGPRDFLFGAPADMGTLYKPNSVLSWCSTLLKTATGDPAVRLHTLRHTSISRMVSEVLCSSAWLDVNRLEIIAGEAGHVSPVTTLFTYTHSYESALRLWLDIAVQASSTLKSSSAPYLLGVSDSASRKSASRSGLSASDWMWHKLRNSFIAAKDAEPRYLVSDTQPKPPVDITKVNRFLTIGVARSILKELLRGTSYRTIGWRYAIDSSHLSTSVNHLRDYCIAMAHQMHPRTAVDQFAHSGVADVLSVVDIDFEKSDQLKFDALWGNMELSPNVELLRAAVESWSACRKGTYIGLSNLQNITGLLRLLKEANVDLSVIQVCLQSSASESSNRASSTSFDANLSAVSQAINSIFAAILHRPVRTLSVVQHPDRPLAYLRWNSPGTSFASGGSTRGLDAFLICVHFYLLLSGRQ